MKSYHEKTGTSTRIPVFERFERMHPFKMINYLGLSISGILYAFISFMFIKHLVFELNGNFEFDLPKFFTVSTMLLICSVYFSSQLKKAYLNDDIPLIQKTLSIMFVAGVSFFVSQSIAWIELLQQEVFPKTNNIVPYLFAVSALHLAFVLAGMVMSGFMFYNYMLIEHDPVKTLIVTTNPAEKMKLENLMTYWHFNTIAWTVLFLMFLFIF